MKKSLSILLALAMLLSLAACGTGSNDTQTSAQEISQTAAPEKAAVNIAVLKGPTGIGAAFLMEKNDAGNAANNYNFSVEGAPDVVTADIISGALDIAAVPTNVALSLYNSTGGKVKLLAVNTLGVLHVLERGSTVNSFADLAGKKVVTAGNGTTVSGILDKLTAVCIDKNAKTPEFTYATEHAEALALAIKGDYDICILPEPFATQLLTKDSSFRDAVDITAQWTDAGLGTLAMGALVVSTEFAQQNPEALDAFLEEYGQSVASTNANVEKAAQLTEKYDIMAASIAQKAIPGCNIVCITGDGLKAAVEPFYNVLFEYQPKLVGGARAVDDFYYIP